jgi:hypothetical protein
MCLTIVKISDKQVLRNQWIKDSSGFSGKITEIWDNFVMVEWEYEETTKVYVSDLMSIDDKEFDWELM